MRIGIAAARAMSLAAGIPVLGLTTLEVIAAGIDGTETGPHPVLACVESKREDIYAQLFGADGSRKRSSWPRRRRRWPPIRRLAAA